jgi:hypothetical protein
MRLRVRPEAFADILDTARWYEARRAGLGAAFVEEVHAAFGRIEAGPLRYAVVHGAFRRAFAAFRFRSTSVATAPTLLFSPSSTSAAHGAF